MPVFFYIVITRVSAVFHHPRRISVFLESHYLQVHAAWVPEESVCILSNTSSFKLSVTSTFITDVVLLVIMLVGLLRLRLHIFGLGELLWKQVGHATFRPFRSLMRFPCERV